MRSLNCLSASVIAALLMTISVFLGNLGHTEYKSQMRKRKLNKIECVDVDFTTTDTQDSYEDI